MKKIRLGLFPKVVIAIVVGALLVLGLMTIYLALDGYGPAVNVSGDAAIAVVTDRIFRNKTV